MREDCTQNDLVIDDYKISTWYSEGVDPQYHAVNMTFLVDYRLHGFDLTEKEKKSLPDLMASYSRLVEEFGLIGFGETEFEAIQDLFSKATLLPKGYAKATIPSIKFEPKKYVC